MALPGRVGYQLERLFKSNLPGDEERTAALDVVLCELVRGLGGRRLAAPTPALLKLLDRALRAGALPPPGGNG
ncbi:MAG: hypothetical protein HY329_18480 [Chloroflexi bacterium]|nr:hypothetical protein [Chloroflexota bacterium]